MSTQLPCGYLYNMRAATCSYRVAHPPYTPGVLARPHARQSVACFVAGTLSFLADRPATGAGRPIHRCRRREQRLQRAVIEHVTYSGDNSGSRVPDLLVELW